MVLGSKDVRLAGMTAASTHVSNVKLLSQEKTKSLMLRMLPNISPSSQACAYLHRRVSRSISITEGRGWRVLLIKSFSWRQIEILPAGEKDLTSEKDAEGGSLRRLIRANLTSLYCQE